PDPAVAATTPAAPSPRARDREAASSRHTGATTWRSEMSTCDRYSSVRGVRLQPDLQGPPEGGHDVRLRTTRRPQLLTESPHAYQYEHDREDQQREDVGPQIDEAAPFDKRRPCNHAVVIDRVYGCERPHP